MNKVRRAFSLRSCICNNMLTWISEAGEKKEAGGGEEKIAGNKRRDEVGWVDGWMKRNKKRAERNRRRTRRDRRWMDGWIDGTKY